MSPAAGEIHGRLGQVASYWRCGTVDRALRARTVSGMVMRRRGIPAALRTRTRWPLAVAVLVGVCVPAAGVWLLGAGALGAVLVVAGGATATSGSWLLGSRTCAGGVFVPGAWRNR